MIRGVDVERMPILLGRTIFQQPEGFEAREGTLTRWRRFGNRDEKKRKL
jgi:hypothetical protein